MRAAPINPADLNQIEGKYPVRPQLRQRPDSKARFGYRCWQERQSLTAAPGNPAA